MKLRAVRKCIECEYFYGVCWGTMNKVDKDTKITCERFKLNKEERMKQTKKPTRAQYDFLESRKKSTEGVRIIEETYEYLRYFDKDGNERKLYK